MRFPVVLLCPKYSSDLPEKIFVAMTGMGVNMGDRLDSSDGVERFNDLDFEGLTKSYLKNEISIIEYQNSTEDIFSDRSGSWGFKTTLGCLVLPLLMNIFPDMSIAYEREPTADKISRGIDELRDRNLATDPTIMDVSEQVNLYVTNISKFTELTTFAFEEPTFNHHRRSLLHQMARFLFVGANGQDLTSFVESANTKLSTIYSEKEIGSGQTE